MSLPEVLLWRAVRAGRFESLKIRRQHPVGPYVLDFYCSAARLAIEVDGGMHYVGDRPERDAARDQWLLNHEIATLRLPARFVLSDMDATLLTILREVETRTAEARLRDPPRD